MLAWLGKTATGRKRELKKVGAPKAAEFMTLTDALAGFAFITNEVRLANPSLWFERRSDGQGADAAEAVDKPGARAKLLLTPVIGLVTGPGSPHSPQRQMR